MSQSLSVALITKNEETNLGRTLASVAWAEEIVIVDSGSSDGTEAVARRFNARFFVEPWKGFAAQKNSAIGKCSSDWILSLDADERVSEALAKEIRGLLDGRLAFDAYSIPRRNVFLGRWIQHGGFYPDRKLRLFRRGSAVFEPRPVHETLHPGGNPESPWKAGQLRGDLIHDAYPTLESFIEHMNRYSELGASIAAASGKSGRSLFSFLSGVLANPMATFAYNYVLRLGFLDGREGLLLHLYHSAYVSWKYAKAWEVSGKAPSAKG